MSSSYQKILKKITDTEKRLKPNKQDISNLMELENEERKALNINNDDIVEEYRNLKENISGNIGCCYSLAYHPVKITKRKWSHQDL